MLTRLNLILDPTAMSQNLKTGHSVAGEGGNWFQSESLSFRGLDYARLGLNLVHAWFMNSANFEAL